MTFKLEIERLGNILDLDEYKIKEALEHGKSTLISPDSTIKECTGSGTRTAGVLRTWR